jgi:hypothetical protein
MNLTINLIRERLEEAIPQENAYEKGRWGIFYKGHRIPISWGGGINSYGEYRKALHSLYNVANRIYEPKYKDAIDKQLYRNIIDELIDNREIEIKQL